jgi:hypothetical protein
MINGNEKWGASITGLKSLDLDYINDVPVTYLDGLTSNIQDQIDAIDTGGGGGGTGSPAYTGSFYDTTTQYLSTINTAYAITFNSTDTSVSNGVALGTTTSRIYNTYAGIYNIQTTLYMHSPANNSAVVVWIKKNGSNLGTSMEQIFLPTKTGTTGVGTLCTFNTIENLAAGDYLEFFMLSNTDAGCHIAPLFISGLPSSPSIMVTYNSVVGQGLKGDAGTNGSNGANGANGYTPVLSVGTVSHSSTATPAVTIVETVPNYPVLNFVLKDGADGAIGITPNFTIGSVAHDVNAVPAVSITGGDPANPVLNFLLKDGRQGNDGDRGPTGDKGNTGDDGKDGSNGDSSAATGAAIAAGAAAAVASAAAIAAAASAAAAEVSASASAASAASVEAQVAELEPRVEALEAKTTYQEAGIGSTDFKSNVKILDTLGTEMIKLGADGNIDCDLIHGIADKTVLTKTTLQNTNANCPLVFAPEYLADYQQTGVHNLVSVNPSTATINTTTLNLSQTVDNMEHPVVKFNSDTGDQASQFWDKHNLHYNIYEGAHNSQFFFSSVDPLYPTSKNTFLKASMQSTHFYTNTSFVVSSGTSPNALYITQDTTSQNPKTSINQFLNNVAVSSQTLTTYTHNSNTSSTFKINDVAKLTLGIEAGNTTQAVNISGGLRVDTLFMHTKQHVNGYAMTVSSSVFGGGYPFERVYYHNYPGNCTFTLPPPTMGGPVFTVIFGYTYTNIISSGSTAYIKGKQSWTATNSYAMPVGQQTITFAPTDGFYYEI